jgi:hypothetical protein
LYERTTQTAAGLVAPDCREFAVPSNRQPTDCLDGLFVFTVSPISAGFDYKKLLTVRGYGQKLER